MKWEPWSRIDYMGLARYVTPEAKQWLTLDISRFDAGNQRRAIIDAIYNALVQKNISYDLEKYHPSNQLQLIRTPAEILDAPREGTCLDLATLFCGLCLSNELLPLIIVIEGHALAAVSLTHGVRDWDGYRPERNWFDNGPLSDQALLHKLIDEGSYLAIECTGFAHSEKLGQILNNPSPETIGRTNGVLSFERAVKAGREQLSWPARPLEFALDVAIARYAWRFEPYPLNLITSVLPPSIYQSFSQASTPLSTYIRIKEFEALVNERTKEFIGRDFIFNAIYNYLKDPNFPSGYVFIKGEPGIGKTSLIGQLVKQRGYVHHFNIASQNIRSTQNFLSNVCTQLIVRYELDYPTLPPQAIKDGGFLSQLLTEVAEKAQGTPVVVLVDALDEAEDVGLPPNVNRLYLPQALPNGVFIIVTTREEEDYRLFVDRREDIHLRDGDPQNEEDVRQYIRNFVTRYKDQILRHVVEWNVDEEGFVTLITKKSEGNFMYLVFVLRDIRDGNLTKDTIDDIQNLPKGLEGYYQRHWRTMKAQERERFENLYEPIVCTLAVVREPVTITQLMEWTKRLVGVQLSPLRIKEVIQEWRQFLNEDRSEQGEPLYRIYHASFQEFLAKEVGLLPFHKNIALAAISEIQW